LTSVGGVRLPREGGMDFITRRRKKHNARSARVEKRARYIKGIRLTGLEGPVEKRKRGEASLVVR